MYCTAKERPKSTRPPSRASLVLRQIACAKLRAKRKITDSAKNKGIIQMSLGYCLLRETSSRFGTRVASAYVSHHWYVPQVFVYRKLYDNRLQDKYKILLETGLTTHKFTYQICPRDIRCVPKACMKFALLNPAIDSHALVSRFLISSLIDIESSVPKLQTLSETIQ